MASKQIADKIFSIKENLSDKDFKDIMDLLSIKNKEEEDDVELYEFTFMKMKKPRFIKFPNSSNTFGYNFTDYKIKTKNVIIDKDVDTDVLTNKNNILQRMVFDLRKIKDKNYYILSNGIFGEGMMGNSTKQDIFKNLFDSDDSDDDDDDCNCDWGCDKCIYKKMKNEKSVNIIYRKMIGLSLKKL